MTARLRAARRQAGVTMVEMAVVVALLGLVLAMALQSVSSYQRAVVAADLRQQNLEQARVVMAVLTKDLRTATELTAISASDVTFRGLLNTAATADPSTIQLDADSGSLVEVVTPATTGATPVSRTVGRGLVNTGNLFSFRDSSDSVTTTRTAVTSVVITLSVDLPSGQPVPPTVLTSRVFLPNVAAAASEE
jgi:prepilin-type N-terminal cleavage/methylation domain-containing protein